MFKDTFQRIGNLSKYGLMKAWRTQLHSSTDLESALVAWRQKRREVLNWPLALGLPDQATCFDVHQKSFAGIYNRAASFALPTSPAGRIQLIPTVSLQQMNQAEHLRKKTKLCKNWFGLLFNVLRLSGWMWLSQGVWKGIQYF